MLPYWDGGYVYVWVWVGGGKDGVEEYSNSDETTASHTNRAHNSCYQAVQGPALPQKLRNGPHGLRAAAISAEISQWRGLVSK